MDEDFVINRTRSHLKAFAVGRDARAVGDGWRATADADVLDPIIGVLPDNGADVVVMGCAGMARYRKPLQDAIGVPTVRVAAFGQKRTFR